MELIQTLTLPQASYYQLSYIQLFITTECDLCCGEEKKEVRDGMKDGNSGYVKEENPAEMKEKIF